MAHAHDIEGQVTYTTFSFYQVVAKGNAFLSALTDPHLCDNPVKYLRFKGGQATCLTPVVDPGEILPPGHRVHLPLIESVAPILYRAITLTLMTAWSTTFGLRCGKLLSVVFFFFPLKTSVTS